MSLVYETVVSRLGARFALNFRPVQKNVKLSPLGRFFDAEAKLCVGVRLGNETRILPFSDEYPAFPFIDQELTPTSVKFHCNDVELGVYALIEFISPFRPRDEKKSGAPFFFVKATVEYRGSTKMEGDAFLNQQDNQVEAEFILSLHGETLKKDRMLPDGFVLSMISSIDPELAEQKWLNKTKGKEFSSAPYKGEIGVFCKGAEACGNGLKKTFTAVKHVPVVLNAVIGAFTNEKVFNINDVLYRFYYTQWFSSVEEVAQFAMENMDELQDSSSLFENAVTEACGGHAMSHLVSMAFQTYLCNSWWMINEKGEEWYTAWEGNCAYHSTIDVEYNIAPFYLLFWPELLEKLLAQWKDYERPEGYMPHDIGKFLVGKGMEYSHDMEVEETCNYILLVYALYRYTGKKELLASYYPQIKRLANYVKRSDTTGNGFPNEGTATTFDDACPAVQYSKEQSYLAIKAYSALCAAGELAREMGETGLADSYEEQRAKIQKTLDSRAWLGDHYAVCIDKNADGIVNVWTGEKMSGEMEGWDAYSIYCTNGLLYLFMTGTSFDLNREHLKQDIVNATRKSMIHFACKHSSSDNTNNFWISQNLWKDMTAAYLGVDMTDFAEKYWESQLSCNQQGFRGCFVDSSTLAGLFCYPRGITALGMFYACAGITVNEQKKEISMAPVKLPYKTFLFSFADWQNGVIPSVSFQLKDGKVSAEITNRDLLSGYRITLFGREISSANGKENKI